MSVVASDGVGARVRVGMAVPAAGTGRRMGGASKPFLELAGRPMLLHVLEALLADSRVERLVVALAPEDAHDPPRWLLEVDARVGIVAGGVTRGHSVRNALEALEGPLDLIGIHDAARPLVTASLVGRCIERAATGVGAVAGTPAIDTIKRVDDAGRVLETPVRTTLWHAHTPQIFPAAVLREAYGPAADVATATDDAALVERVGGTVTMVDDGGANLKVTRVEDLSVAEALLRTRRP